MFKKRNIKAGARNNQATRRIENDDNSDNENSDREVKPEKTSDNEDEEKETRKRGSSSEDETVVVRKKAKKSGINPMIQKSSSIRSNRDATQNFSDSDENNEQDISREQNRRSEAERKKPSQLVEFTFKSSRSGVVAGPEDMGATATVEVDTAHDRDRTAVLERQHLAQETGESSSEFYTGKDNYTQFYKPQEKPRGVKAALKGPVRAPSFLRATTRWDYAPDICKDYKETGFCGFGDSCKFLHDRSDYKFGWQLENEYMEQHKPGGVRVAPEDPSQYEISSDEDELPFKCLICRESFQNPVVTKCKHYFCEKCAIAHCRKSMRCYACGVDTKGMFNPAKEITAKMNRMSKSEETKAAGTSRDSD